MSVANISNNLTIQKPLAVYAENMELYPLDLYGQIKYLLSIHRKTSSVTMTMQLFLLQVSELAIYICLRPTHTRVFFLQLSALHQFTGSEYVLHNTATCVCACNTVC